MTADVQAQLAEALAAQHSCDTLLTIRLCNRCKQSAAAVLPVVERLVAEAAMRGRAALTEEIENVAVAQDASSVRWSEGVAEADNDTDRGYATGRAHAAEQAALHIRQAIE